MGMISPKITSLLPTARFLLQPDSYCVISCSRVRQGRRNKQTYSAKWHFESFMMGNFPIGHFLPTAGHNKILALLENGTADNVHSVFHLSDIYLQYMGVSYSLVCSMWQKRQKVKKKTKRSMKLRTFNEKL